MSLVAAWLALNTHRSAAAGPRPTAAVQGSEGPTPAAHASRDTPTPSPRRVVVLGGVEGDDHPRRATKLTSDKRHQKENLTNKPNKVKRITYGRGYGGFSDGNRCGIAAGKS